MIIRYHRLIIFCTTLVLTTRSEMTHHTVCIKANTIPATKKSHPLSEEKKGMYTATLSPLLASEMMIVSKTSAKIDFDLLSSVSFDSSSCTSSSRFFTATFIPITIGTMPSSPIYFESIREIYTAKKPQQHDTSARATNFPMITPAFSCFVLVLLNNTNSKSRSSISVDTKVIIDATMTANMMRLYYFLTHCAIMEEQSRGVKKCHC